MAKSTPQDKYFRYTKLFNRSSSWLLVITVILPILNAVITNSTIDSLLNLINFGVMVVYAGATFFGTFHLLPESENIRRSDYFHNTFGIPTTDDSSEEYFTNDDIERGFYKMAVNMFENCFFSLKVSSEMLLRSMIKMLVFVLILIYFAYMAFKTT
ncbi:hypothetical protein A2801_03165 [Candidatus Woesebacteria bacterium RIFCSPHIGHO2_01_FULL_41_10]|uniref:Uncharacterized protein n=1 Tax=Candidatus Woesebacteria bacterium RIFCSPHIGHO2_01_FULL_41_10 TaxID=1802500 RepID=A0A1F7YS07_9BACT|nr:MAG: hypothetical protein A2801_03165 [Candidatus Woesebacteria bacterium RIFCSPHIGHO2_01_FULL_41_10]